MTTLLVATRSSDKLAEIRRILAPISGLEVVDLNDAGIPSSPDEDGIEPHDTFEDNAASKARYFQALGGLPTVADDSGLVVDALGGAPGVRSKRFAPERGLQGEARDLENNRHLLELLQGTPEEERTARYVCVAVLVDGAGEESRFRGEARGRIAEAPRGRAGFGYDPLFFDPELGRTFAEITREEKNERSHRGRAFRALGQHLLGEHLLTEGL